MSVLDVDGPGFGIEVRLVSRDGKRLRRALLRDFYQKIHPWLKGLKEGFQPTAQLDHVACGVIRSKRAMVGIRIFREGESQELGSEIRKLRLKAGLSQEELAQRIGIQRTHLSDIERGIYRPKAETLNDIRDALLSHSAEGDTPHGSEK